MGFRKCYASHPCRHRWSRTNANQICAGGVAWSLSESRCGCLCFHMEKKSNLSDRFVIIMAGGRGERFWPLSREKMPKQLLTLLGKRSFLQSAVDRVLPLVPVKNIFAI